MATTVAMFGFGEVGLAMATRLLSLGYVVNVWSRSPEKLTALEQAGTIVQPTEVDAIKSADLIISSLPDSPSLQEVLFHNDWAHELHGRTILHFGSLNASRSQAIMDAFQAHQSSYIEVAAMGNREQVKSGKWQLFVGAEQTDYESVKNLLADLSNNVTYIGAVGDAAALKLALQQLTVSVFCAFSSSISLIKESGVDIDVFMKFLRQSPVYAPMFDNALGALLDRDYAQAVTPSKHIEKDLKLFLEATDELGLTTHHVESIRELIGFCVARGLKDLDFTAVHDVINPPKE